MALGLGTSKYLAVRERLFHEIAGMDVGTKLPNEALLCEKFGVSRITLRSAVDGLVRDGRLVREQGRGTFVSQPARITHYPEQFADVVHGFYRQQTAAGHVVHTRVLRQELVPATADIARQLSLAPEDPVVEVVRLRYVNSQLHQHVITYLSHQRFPNALTADFSQGSLFDYLREHYGVTLTRNDLTVRVEEPTAEVALNLEVEAGTRLLSIVSTVLDQSETPVAFGVARHTPNNSEIALSLHMTDTSRDRPTQ